MKSALALRVCTPDGEALEGGCGLAAPGLAGAGPAEAAGSAAGVRPGQLERKRAVSLKLINIGNGMTWLPTGKHPL